MSTYGNNHGFGYSFKDLVNAGELQYTEKTMEDIAKDIANKYENDPNHDFKSLISDTIRPIMYMLKRQQKLSDFLEILKAELMETTDTPSVSQRLLIDTIMMNSDRFLRRTLISLLSKRNPVPVIQPQTDLTKNQYRSIMSIIHIWDFQRPILLSFGIGSCKGKTSLLNAVFESNFEESIDDAYFDGTVDVDFGFHFNDRRPVNIADTHGEISIDILNQISMLFNGFLVQVEGNYLVSNQTLVIEYLKSLPSQSYIRLLIRDVKSENDPKIKSSVEAIQSAFPICQVSYLTNVVDKNTAQNRTKIRKLRECIFNDASILQCFDETSIQIRLEKLLDDNEKQMIEQEKAFIKRIQHILVKGKIEHYPLYSLFITMCKKRSDVAIIDPYDRNFQSDKLYELNDELFKADSEFKNTLQMGPNHFGDGFKYFFELLGNQESRLAHLHLLSMEFIRQREKQATNYQDISFYERLSLEIHWRNAIIGSTSLPKDKQQMLINAYRDYITEGNPFEIVDGDNFEMQGSFLTEVFQLFPGKKFFVISVIGPQNSGKSTLLNFLFGASFEAREGRCTKGNIRIEKTVDLLRLFYFVGIYGTLINIQNLSSKDKLVPLDYDYVFIIDTEGLLSVQKSNEQYDKSLILFCLAVSHLVIVNVDGEISDPVKKCFLLCTQALKYLGETRVRRPTVHFVLNKRQDSNKDYCKTLIECIEKALHDNKLTNEINLQTENFHILPIAFNFTVLKSNNKEFTASLFVPTFITRVQELCKALIDMSSDIIRETGNDFCVPTNWIKFANRVLQTIKKHPSLTYFQDVFERKQYEEIREDIRQDFDQYLSPGIARVLIEKEKENDSEHIKDSFKAEYHRILNILENKLKEHCNKHEATENIRERSLQLMQVQIINIFRSWEVSAIMKSERCKNNQINNEIEQKLKTKATSITHKDPLMDVNKATQMLEEEFDSLVDQIIKNTFKSESVWKKCIELVSHLCDVLNTDDLPSSNDLLAVVPFLTTLDPCPNTPLIIDDCLSKIRAQCTSQASNLEPLASHPTNTSQTKSIEDLKRSYTFLNSDKLTRYFVEVTASSEKTRGSFRQGARQQYAKIFQEHGRDIIEISTCFTTLIGDIGECLLSKRDDELSTEIKFVQEILGIVNKIILNFNNELNIFGFCLSKQFCSSLYTCAIISTALHYYNQQKTNFIDVIDDLNKKKSKLVEKYIPWMILVENDDKNVATNFTNELSKVLLDHSFEPQIRNIIENQENDVIKTIRRSIIIQELDDQVKNAEDDWLMRYVLYPQQLILERFERKWTTLKIATDEQSQKNINQILGRLNEIFNLLETMNEVLKKEGGHSLTFVDDLFKSDGDQSNSLPSDKKFCMAQLFYNYLVEEQIPAEITTRAGSKYIINDRWKNLIDNFPMPNEKMKQIFRLMKNALETATISYVGLFLDRILDQRDKTISAITAQMNLFISKINSKTHDSLMKQVEGCGTQCPCCKRICDVDHRLNVTSPVGQGENRHRCQFGHQIRAMGGIRYEVTAEASMAWCEIIKDDDPVTTNNNIRQTWKTFKNSHTDWDFGDSKIRGNLETRYSSIWKRIGRKLCDTVYHGMKFVEKNSPPPINHFILILDHSDSMNETNGTLQTSTPWKKLLQAVKAFRDIRTGQVSFNDQITAIVFANRVQRIFNFENLKDINVERLDIPNTICGMGTMYSVAFQAAIKTLEEANNHQERSRFRQTIIFMTDGEPQDNSSTELQKLCDWREGS